MHQTGTKVSFKTITTSYHERIDKIEVLRWQHMYVTATLIACWGAGKPHDTLCVRFIRCWVCLQCVSRLVICQFFVTYMIRWGDFGAHFLNSLMWFLVYLMTYTKLCGSIVMCCSASKHLCVTKRWNVFLNLCYSSMSPRFCLQTCQNWHVGCSRKKR